MDVLAVYVMDALPEVQKEIDWCVLKLTNAEKPPAWIWVASVVAVFVKLAGFTGQLPAPWRVPARDLSPIYEGQGGIGSPLRGLLSTTGYDAFHNLTFSTHNRSLTYGFLLITVFPILSMIKSQKLGEFCFQL